MIDDSILGCATTEYGVKAVQQLMEIIAKKALTIQIPMGLIKEVIGAAENIYELQAHHEEAAGKIQKHWKETTGQIQKHLQKTMATLVLPSILRKNKKGFFKCMRRKL
jgi:hypothetical protein